MPPKPLPRVVIKKAYQVVAEKPPTRRAVQPSRGGPARKAVAAPRRRKLPPLPDQDLEDNNNRDNDNSDNDNPDNDNAGNDDPDYDNLANVNPDDEDPLEDPFSDGENPEGSPEVNASATPR